MEELEVSTGISTEEKEARIRAAFDAARKDIAVIQAKKECKKEEMSVLASELDATSNIPPSSGTVLTNTHPQDSEVRAVATWKEFLFLEYSLIPPSLYYSHSSYRRRTCNLPYIQHSIF